MFEAPTYLASNCAACLKASSGGPPQTETREVSPPSRRASDTRLVNDHRLAGEQQNNSQRAFCGRAN